MPRCTYAGAELVVEPIGEFFAVEVNGVIMPVEDKAVLPHEMHLFTHLLRRGVPSALRREHQHAYVSWC